MRVDLLAPIIVAAGLGTVGVDLFAYYMPDEVKDGILMLAADTGTSINANTPGFRRNDTFQVIVRSEQLQTALTKAFALFNLLTTTSEITITPADPTLPALQIKKIVPLHDPFVYPRQIGGEFEVSVNFESTYVVPTGTTI